MDGLVRFGLSAKGVSEEAIDAIDRLAGLENKLFPHLKAIESDFPEILDIIKQAWPDILLAAPAIAKLIKGT